MFVVPGQNTKRAHSNRLLKLVNRLLKPQERWWPVLRASGSIAQLLGCSVAQLFNWPDDYAAYICTIRGSDFGPLYSNRRGDLSPHLTCPHSKTSCIATIRPWVCAIRLCFSKVAVLDITLRLDSVQGETDRQRRT